MAICPYCKDSVFREAAYQCPICGAVHHEECWSNNRDRCSVYGCKSGSEGSWLGCPWCDEFYPAERRICMLCGSQLLTIEEFWNVVDGHDWVSLGPQYADVASLVAGYLRNEGITTRVDKKAPVSMFGIAGPDSVLVLREQQEWAKSLMRALYERSRDCDLCGHVVLLDEECSYCSEGVSV